MYINKVLLNLLDFVDPHSQVFGGTIGLQSTDSVESKRLLKEGWTKLSGNFVFKEAWSMIIETASRLKETKLQVIINVVLRGFS